MYLNPENVQQFHRDGFLFFHCNLLHTSDPNASDRHRRSFIVCYNALANPQLAKTKTADQHPCPVSADNAILQHAALVEARPLRYM